MLRRCPCGYIGPSACKYHQWLRPSAKQWKGFSHDDIERLHYKGHIFHSSRHRFQVHSQDVYTTDPPSSSMSLPRLFRSTKPRPSCCLIVPYSSISRSAGCVGMMSLNQIFHSGCNGEEYPTSQSFNLQRYLSSKRNETSMGGALIVRYVKREVGDGLMEVTYGR